MPHDRPPRVRILIEIDGTMVEVAREKCSPTTRIALAEVVAEAIELVRATPAPVPSKPGPKLSPPEHERLRPARSGA